VSLGCFAMIYWALVRSFRALYQKLMSYIYVHIYVYIQYIYIYICMYIFVYIYIYIYIHICTHVYVYMYTFTFMYMYVYVYIYTYMYIYVYSYIYIYIHICMYAYTYLHTYKYVWMNIYKICIVTYGNIFIQIFTRGRCHSQWGCGASADAAPQSRGRYPSPPASTHPLQTPIKCVRIHCSCEHMSKI